MKDVVVLAGTTPWSVLSLCKAAKKHGANTYCVCTGLSRPMDYSRSRYVTESYNVDKAELFRFWEDFFKIHQFQEKPILFAVYDGACLFVDENRDYYESHFDLCLPSSLIVKTFNDKSLAGDMAEANGMMVPKTINIECTSQVDEVCETFMFPVIVKPTTSDEHVKFKFKMKVFENADEFRTFSNGLLENHCHFICQEYIKGGDADCKFYIFYRSKKGALVECMGEKTLQSNGIMTIGTTKYDEALASLCRAFIENIDYVGIGGIEVKYCNGQYYFIEMSTRTEGFVAISDMAEVSLANAAYLDINGGVLPRVKQIEGVKYVVSDSWISNRKRNKQYLLLFSEVLSMAFDGKSHFVTRFFNDKMFADYYKK